ncbi:MAG: type II secretion system protein GspE, partial [Luminiphilus sp.]
MNTAADNLDVTDALETAASEDSTADTRGGLLPFGFSQAKQVVLESSEDGLTLSYVGQLDTETLLEVRRTAGANFA